jgi:hypothetical protein
MNEKKQNTGMIYGGIAGLTLIVLTTILYLGGVELYLGRVRYLGYIMMIGLAVMATLMQRRANGGWLDFQSALKMAFTVMALALAVQTLFAWILLNFLDTHFKEVLGQAVIAKWDAYLRAEKVGGEQFDRTMADVRGKDQFSFGAMSLGYALSCIAHFFVAVLIAAIVKRKKNEIPEAAFQ